MFRNVHVSSLMYGIPRIAPEGCIMLTERFFVRGLWMIGCAIAALAVWAVLLCEGAA
jgi:hypothetical protein